MKCFFCQGEEGTLKPTVYGYIPIGTPIETFEIPAGVQLEPCYAHPECNDQHLKGREPITFKEPR